MKPKKEKTIINLPPVAFDDLTKSYCQIHTPFLNFRTLKRECPDLFKPPASPQELKKKKYTEQFISCIEKIKRKPFSVDARQKIETELGGIADAISRIVKYSAQDNQEQITDKSVEISDYKII